MMDRNMRLDQHENKKRQRVHLNGFVLTRNTQFDNVFPITLIFVIHTSCYLFKNMKKCHIPSKLNLTVLVINNACSHGINK